MDGSRQRTGGGSDVAAPDVDINAVEAALMQELPDGWSAAISRQTGGVFYVNSHTGETQSETPTLPAAALDLPSPEVVPLPLALNAEPEPEPEPQPAHFLPVSPSATSYDHNEDMDRSVGAKPWIEPSKAPSAGELEAGLSVAPCLIEAEDFLAAMGGRSPMELDRRRATQLSHACIAAGKECLCVAQTEDEYRAVLDLFNTAWRLTPDHPKLGQLIADASEASTFALASRRGSTGMELPPQIGADSNDALDTPVVAVPNQEDQPEDDIDDAAAAVAAAVAEGAAATVCAPRIRSLRVCNVPRQLFEIGALHFRLLDDERNSLAGAGAVELFDSRAAPPDGTECINRASEMAEEPRTHTVVSMSVIEYTVQVRLPPSPAEPTLVLYYTPDGYQTGGKLVPVLSVRLTESVLRGGVVEVPAGRPAARETICRINAEHLSIAVGQRTSGLNHVWLELTVVEGGGVPRRSGY